MEESKDTEKRVQIDPLPEEKPAVKKKMGRPRIPDEVKLARKKTGGKEKHVLTTARKMALEKARVVRNENRKKSQVNDPRAEMNLQPEGGIPSAVPANVYIPPEYGQSLMSLHQRMSELEAMHNKTIDILDRQVKLMGSSVGTTAGDTSQPAPIIGESTSSKRPIVQPIGMKKPNIFGASWMGKY